MNELVSIVIPTYNRADLIEESILSSVQQTYPNKEIIVVDDGSTDDTKEICKKYVTSGQIRYIYKQNEGIGSALNRGISEMKGMWFKWLSSDDILIHNAVQELLHCALENNAKVVYSDFMMIDQHGHKLREVIEPGYSTYLDYASNLWQRHIGNGSSILMHKSVFEQVGTFDTTLKWGEDYDFWLRACILHGIMFYRCPGILMGYRMHSQQLSETVRGDDRIIERTRNYEKIHERIKKRYISMHGKGAWNALMDEFKKRGKLRPLWRRMARKLLIRYLPWGAATFLITIYQSMKEEK